MGCRWRTLAVLTLFLSATLAGGTLWRLGHPAVGPFVVPGATNIQIVTIGVGEWQVTYASPGPPLEWYFTLAHTLVAQQWHDRTRWHADESPRFDQVNPLHFEREYAGVLWDEVMLLPDDRDPQRATIVLRRHLRIPWWSSWSPTGNREAEVIVGKKLNTTRPEW